MKKILLIMPSLFIGGAERSLLGLLESFDYSRVDVSLFLYRHEGEFMKYIPKQVHLLPEIPQYRTFDVPIKSLLFSKQVGFGIARMLSKISMHLHYATSSDKRGVWQPMQYTSKFLQPLLPNIPGEYDLGIMFLGVADTLINKVKASVKMAWCHTDYDSLYPNRKLDIEVYKNVDYIVNVSEACTKVFTRNYPQFENKAITIENVLAAKFIFKEAAEPVDDIVTDKWPKLLSIGRFNAIKNFHNIPYFCRYLHEHGIPAHWYIIGYGMDEAKIRGAIRTEHMEKYVTILGKKDNPYPYIKLCDLYVQPSLLEGKSVTVREAQLLQKPVVITNYATSSSQLDDGVDGVIVPIDNEDCAAGIAALLQNPLRMQRLSEQCAMYDYSNSQEIDKIYEVLGA